MKTLKKLIKGFLICCLSLIAMGVVIAACSDSDTVTEEPKKEVAEVVETPVKEEVEEVEAPVKEEVEEPKEEPVAEVEEPEQPEMSISQEQAVRKAEDYINLTAFSKKGLIDQLEFEGFSNEDATYGVENIEVNWNEQAAKKAKEYLDLTPFSRNGLIEQLEFEGFSAEEATHGVNEVGL